MRAGASLVRIFTMRASLMPAPARCVSMAWSEGESSAPSAAAMPPCAQSVAAPLPKRRLHNTVTGIGRQFERGHQAGNARRRPPRRRYGERSWSASPLNG